MNRQEYLDKLEDILKEEYTAKIDEINKKVDIIIKKLDIVEKDTNKMNSHIDFIDNTYSKIKTPLFWMCERVNLLRGARSVPESITSTINDQD